MTMGDAEFLSRVSLFSLTNKSDLERIAKLANRHTFNTGDVIIKEGEPDNRLFIIVRGEVEVVKGMGEEKERRLGTLGPLSYFGEMALVDDLVRSASVVAKKKTEALSLHLPHHVAELSDHARFILHRVPLGVVVHVVEVLVKVREIIESQVDKDRAMLAAYFSPAISKNREAGLLHHHLARRLANRLESARKAGYHGAWHPQPSAQNSWLP